MFWICRLKYIIFQDFIHFHFIHYMLYIMIMWNWKLAADRQLMTRVPAPVRVPPLWVALVEREDHQLKHLCQLHRIQSNFDFVIWSGYVCFASKTSIARFVPYQGIRVGSKYQNKSIYCYSVLTVSMFMFVVFAQTLSVWLVLVLYHITVCHFSSPGRWFIVWHQWICLF